VQYELSLFPQRAVRPGRAAFERYFAARDNYTVRKGKARYDNEDTGVYFSFEFIADPPRLGVGREPPWATFRIDLFRPSFFAEEASHELTAFTTAFGPAVTEFGSADADSYTQTAFLRSWEMRNRRVCGPFPARVAPGDPPFAMVRRRLLAVWQWNYRRKALQVEEGAGVFVPRVWFMRTDEGVATTIIWPDAMAVRAPRVDHVIFSRHALAPRRRLRGRRPDVAVVPWATIATSITGSAFYDSLLASWRVSDRRVLNALTEVVATLRGASDIPEFVPADKVLDREGFESASATTSRFD
jgi:hypothetical protein